MDRKAEQTQLTALRITFKKKKKVILPNFLLFANIPNLYLSHKENEKEAIMVCNEAETFHKLPAGCYCLSFMDVDICLDF